MADRMVQVKALTPIWYGEVKRDDHGKLIFVQGKPGIPESTCKLYTEGQVFDMKEKDAIENLEHKHIDIMTPGWKKPEPQVAGKR